MNQPTGALTLTVARVRLGRAPRGKPALLLDVKHHASVGAAVIDLALRGVCVEDAERAARSAAAFPYAPKLCLTKHNGDVHALRVFVDRMTLR